MKKFFNSFYGKISVVFLVMLVVLGFVQATITVQSCINFMAEAKQKLNLPLAQNIADDFQPHLQNGIDSTEIKKAIHGMMVINPEIEIFLLDEQGKILACFMDDQKKLVKTHVSLTPINQFLKLEKNNFTILGDDPCYTDQQKIFSVAPIKIGGKKGGFVYVMLGGAPNTSPVDRALDNYIVQGTLKLLLLIFVGAAAIGLTLFFLLTKRFQSMQTAVKKFREGELNHRIDVKSKDELGQLAAAFNLMADEIVKNMDEMKTKDRLRRDLIANISHDLRSPLTAIQGYLETIIIKSETISEEKKKDLLDTIFKNTTQLNRLVSELFELSKLDAKQTQPNPEPFSLPELIQDVLLKFKQRADKKKVQLISTFPEKLPLVFGDIGLIERALSNLIDNALNYTSPKGNITVELIKKNKKIKIKVVDTGRGIPTEDLPFVFDRFYRVEKSRTRIENSGAGLGLAITKKILEAHNSQISVSSILEEGTAFSFDLPMEA